MDKIERVRATLAGRPVDRAPLSVWYHFGTQHASAERAAQVHLEFFDHYDLDLLKLMNDYDYPMPEGMEVIATAEDLGRLRPFDPARSPLGTQLRAVELVAQALRGRALFVDTVFNAWNTLKRNLVRHQTPLDTAVLNLDNPITRGFRRDTPGDVLFFSMSGDTPGDGAFVRLGGTFATPAAADEERIIWRRHGQEMDVLGVHEVPLRGRHNVENVLAATAVAGACGIPMAVVAAAVRDFRGVSHRLEIVATVNGVIYVNDSIATAPEPPLGSANDQSADSASPHSSTMKRDTSVAITSTLQPGDVFERTKLIAICKPATPE